jgi:hypothetical protein
MLHTQGGSLQGTGMPIGVILWYSTSPVPALRNRKLHVVVEHTLYTIIRCTLRHLDETDEVCNRRDAAGYFSECRSFFLGWCDVFF